jgi:hypothetical protein
MKKISSLVVSVAALALALSAAPVAVAKDGDILRRGTCTGPSTSKIKLSQENGRIEVEFEVDQNRNGMRWGVVLTRNGTRVLSRTAVTRAPSGSFEVRDVVSPGSPRTRVTAVARAAGTGEVCRAVAVLG